MERLIGILDVYDYEWQFYKSDNEEKLRIIENEPEEKEEESKKTSKKGRELTDEKEYAEMMEQFAIWINSPWSQANEHYTISVNCKDAYTELKENEPIWKCEYYIIGYDMNEALIYGYGNTEEEALRDCKKLFKWLQDEYNKENESF